MNVETAVTDLSQALRLKPDERLERLYLFDRIERSGTSFSLAFVVKRVSRSGLELVALGERAVGDEAPAQDFVRRARFPDSVLPLILAEFIDRCGAWGAVYRDIDLAGEGSTSEQLAELTDHLVNPHAD